jgi:hypothetical protein
MSRYSHKFVEEYTGMVGYGFDRKTDEATVQAYLQMISDDECMKALLPRLAQGDLDRVFDLLSELLRGHLEEGEYHQLFLKEEDPHRPDLQL